MALILRIFKNGADTKNAQNILAEGAQAQTIDSFVNSFAPGTVVTFGEYVALNHDTTGQYDDSPVVQFPAFTIKSQAQAPSGLEDDIDKNSNVYVASSNASATAPAQSAPANPAPASVNANAQSSNTSSNVNIL